MNNFENQNPKLTDNVVKDIPYGNLPVVQPNEAVGNDFALLCGTKQENKRIQIPELSKLINASLQINPDKIQKIYQNGLYTTAFFNADTFTIDLNKDKIYNEIITATASQTDAKIVSYDKLTAPTTIYNQMKRNLVDRQSIESDVIFSINSLGLFVVRFNGEPYILVAEDMLPILNYNGSDISVSLVNEDKQLQMLLKPDNINGYIDARNKATINTLLTQAMIDCLQAGDIKVTKISDTTFKLNFTNPIDANYINNLINQNDWYSTSIVNNKIDFDLRKTFDKADYNTRMAITAEYNSLFNNNGISTPEFPDICNNFFVSQNSTIAIGKFQDNASKKWYTNFDLSQSFIQQLEAQFVAQNQLKNLIFNVIKSNSFDIQQDPNNVYIEYNPTKFQPVCNNALQNIITQNGDVIIKQTSNNTSLLEFKDGIILNPDNLILSINQTSQYSLSKVNNKVQFNINFPTPTPVTADTIIGLANNSDPLTDVIIEKSANASLYRARIPDSVLTKRIQPMIDASSSVTIVKRNWTIQDTLGVQPLNLIVPNNAYRCNFEVDIVGQTPNSFTNNSFWNFRPTATRGTNIIFQIIIDASQIGTALPNVPRWITFNLNMPKIDGYVILTNDGNNWDGKMPVDPKFFQIGYSLSVKLPIGKTVVVSTSGTSFIPLSNVTLPTPQMQFAYSLPLDFTQLKFIDGISLRIDIDNLETRTFNNPTIIEYLNTEIERQNIKHRRHKDTGKHLYKNQNF